MAQIIPWAIKGGLALGTSLLGNKLSKSKPSAQESAVTTQTSEAQKLGMDTARGLLPQAQQSLDQSRGLIGMGTQAYQPVLNYWSSLLSGNRGATTSALAPEISQISKGYQAAGNTSAALNPRGGPSTSFLSELPFAQQRDVSTLMQQSRPAAATNLLQTGSQIAQTGQGVAQTGSNILSNAVNSIYASTAAGRDILNSEENRKRLEAERGRSIGTGLFDLISKYGFPAIDQILKGKPESFSI